MRPGWPILINFSKINSSDLDFRIGGVELAGGLLGPVALFRCCWKTKQKSFTKDASSLFLICNERLKNASLL